MNLLEISEKVKLKSHKQFLIALHENNGRIQTKYSRDIEAAYCLNEGRAVGLRGKAIPMDIRRVDYSNDYIITLK
jgi:hypothetical protein